MGAQIGPPLELSFSPKLGMRACLGTWAGDALSVQSMAKIWEPFNGVSKNWHDFHMSIFVKILDTKIVWFVTTVSVQQDTIWHAVPIVISNLNQKTGVMSNKAQVWPKRHSLFADGQLWIHF